jgi:hypothetical protein
MISPEVIAAVHDLLQTRGLKQSPDEKLGDFVARGLGITPKQATDFLGALNDGNSIVEAQRMAGIPESGLLVEIGRAVGAALGKMTAKL